MHQGSQGKGGGGREGKGRGGRPAGRLKGYHTAKGRNPGKRISIQLEGEGRQAVCALPVGGMTACKGGGRWEPCYATG